MTNYWVDTIVRDFVATLKKPVVVELSAEMPTDEKLDALLKTVAYVSRHKLDAVLLLVHNSENAKQVASLLSKTLTSEIGSKNTSLKK